MRIYNNISAMTAYRALARTDGAITKSMERLSTGLRINSAADDATGLVISEKMRNQITGFSQAIKNSQAGMSMLKTAEGAMGQQHEILGRIRELVVSSNNGTMNSDNLDTIQNEINELIKQIDSIAQNTKYNGRVLLDGSMGNGVAVNTDPLSSTVLDAATGVSSAEISSFTAADTYTITNNADGTLTMTNSAGTKSQTVDSGVGAAGEFTGDLNFDVFGITLSVDTTDPAATSIDAVAGNLVVAGSDNSVAFQVGADIGQAMKVSINNVSAQGLGLGTGAGDTLIVTLDVTDTANFDTTLQTVDNAIDTVGNARASMGSYINRFEANINNLSVTKENLQASESLIRDLDMADEMVQLTRNQVLSQASTAMLAQANQKPQAILQLMR